MGHHVHKKPEAAHIQGMCVKCGVKPQQLRESGKYRPLCESCHNPGRVRVYHKILAMIAAYKVDHPCIDCGEDDPIVLDFDHRDPREKSFVLSDAPTLALAIKEIEKCDIRCANCHRRRTAKEGHRKFRKAFFI